MRNPFVRQNVIKTLSCFDFQFQKLIEFELFCFVIWWISIKSMAIESRHVKLYHRIKLNSVVFGILDYHVLF